MIRPEDFYLALQRAEVSFFTGVPDSLLKGFCAYVTDNVDPENHMIAANEGAAIGLACGYHLATSQIPMVYMQNSGLGNTINPIASLADPEVYSIPMLLLIGWRGEPGRPDEPQHKKQGRVTLELLSTLEIPFVVIDGGESNLDYIIADAVSQAKSFGGPCAIVVKKGTFDNYALAPKSDPDFGWSREDAIISIAKSLRNDDIVVATTGMASRELFEFRVNHGQGHESDFLTVGGMGHASQIALAIASRKKNRRVICIDGDGAALMHMGSLAINGLSGLDNFKHFVLNNEAHDSVGGQPTAANRIRLASVGTACGYKTSEFCEGYSDVALSQIEEFLNAPGPSLMEIKINKGNRSDLGRPTTTPLQNKTSFMGFLKAGRD